MMRGTMMFGAILLLSGAAFADDSMAGMDMSKMGNMKMDGMKMTADPTHCAEMQAQQKAGTLPADMKSMLESCNAAQKSMPAGTQDR